MNDDIEHDEAYVCPPGYVLADCPACGYTNEVHDGSTEQQVVAKCERCNMPEIQTRVRMLSEDQVSEIVASSVASACEKAAGIATAQNRTDWSLAELGAMIANETVANTFGALFAEEEYRRAYETVASRSRGAGGEPVEDGHLDGVSGDDGALDAPDGEESGPEGEGAGGARG